jgi:eukaryotic-like serine/threonine-protein kinase
MAVVWRGFDTQLRRTVAVKVLHAHLHAREEIRRRFDREAHAVARLHHPHILDVYDFSGPDAEPSYLVTEFIRGWTLRTFAEEHPFDPPELAAACLFPIVEALGHAHKAGVVHRDLKPENVMVREDGVIKLTDFGIAALLDPDEKMTVTGSILGSPAHLAPETIEGKATDPRSDLFSFGTIFYWLSCGELPFRAPSPAALLRQILDGKLTDPRSIRPGIGDDQARIIARCLERDPQRRYQTADELRQDLVALLTHAGIDDAQVEVKAFVTAQPPAAHAAQLRARLVALALRRGEEALAQRRTPLALGEFGRALALQPGNALAQGRVDRIRRKERLAALSRKAGIALVSAALIGAGVVRGGRALQSWRSTHALETQIAGALAAPSVKPPGGGPAAGEGTAGASQIAGDPALDAGLPLPASAPGAQASGTGGDPASGAAGPPVGIAAGQEARAAAAVRKEGQGPRLAIRRIPTRVAKPRGDGIGVIPRPVQVAAGKLPVTLKVHYVWGEVTLDGADLGRGDAFVRQLTPGPHTAIVRHPCCADNTQIIEVVPSRDHYTLEHGTPKDAFLKVKNAPLDLRVLVDGGFLSTVSDIAARPIAVGDKPTREVTVTIGDHVGSVTLQAGRPVEVDYLNLAKQTGEP